MECSDITMSAQRLTFIILLNLTFRIMAMHDDQPKITCVGYVNYPTALHGRTSLHIAAERGSVNDIKFYLELKYNIDVQDYFGNTPLHYAIYNERKDASIFLIQQGANESLRNHSDIYPAQGLYEHTYEGPKTTYFNHTKAFRLSVLSAIFNNKIERLELEKKHRRKSQIVEWYVLQESIAHKLNSALAHKLLKSYFLITKKKRSKSIGVGNNVFKTITENIIKPKKRSKAFSTSKS